MLEMTYVVQEITGDYALLRSEDGNTKEVAMFLLPEGTTDGSKLLFSNFSYELL